MPYGSQSLRAFHVTRNKIIAPKPSSIKISKFMGDNSSIITTLTFISEFDADEEQLFRLLD